MSAEKNRDPVRALIEARLIELGLERKSVSKQIGRNDTYLHQFLHRGTPAELRESDRVRLALILKVPEADLEGPQTKEARAPLRKNGATAHSEVAAETVGGYVTPIERNQRIAGRAELFGQQADLPVFGTAEGGSGAIVVTDRPVDYVARPPTLLRVVDGYGIIVSGDSMVPEFKPGATALVNPHAKPRVGDSCIFRCRAEDGTVKMLIKEYRGETETHWRVRQHNPPRDFTLPKKVWVEVHKTVGSYFA